MILKECEKAEQIYRYIPGCQVNCTVAGILSLYNSSN